jgi:hypothetical protein
MRLLPIAEAIALEGEPLSGASPSEIEIIQNLVKETGKAICAVTAWVIIDVIDKNSAPILASGTQPIVMFTHSVLLHSTGEYQQGERIKTGYAVSFDGRGIFETESTVFMLMGDGYRRSASIEVLDAIAPRSWPV